MPEPRLRVASGDPTPPYEQVRRQIADQIAAGSLRAGDRLPPLRQLAGDLGLAVGTVARAYAELEAAGLLTTRRGAGTRVSADARPSRAALLDEIAQDYLDRAAALDIEATEALEAVQRRLDV